MAELVAKIKSGSFWLIIRFILASLVGLVTMPMITRGLTVKQYGIYSMLFSLMFYVATLSSLGINDVFQRFIPDAYQKKDYGFIKNIVFKGLFIRLFSATVFILMLIFFSKEIGSMLGVAGWEEYFSYFSIGIIFFLGYLLFVIVFQGIFLQKYSAIVAIASLLVRFLALCVIFAMGFKLLALIIVEIAIWILSFTLALYFYQHKFVKPIGLVEKTKIPLRRLLSYSGYSAFNEAGHVVFSSATDLLVIGIFLDPFKAGIYGFCCKIADYFWKFLPTGILWEMIVPVFFSRHAKSKCNKELNIMFNFLVKTDLFFTLPLALTVFILGQEIIQIVFGEKYLSAYPVLCVVTSFFVVSTIQSPIGNVLRAVEKMNVVFHSQFFAILNLVGDILVVNKYGIIGIAWVTSISILGKNLYCFYFARKAVDLKVDIAPLLKIVTNGLVVGVLFWTLKSHTQGPISLAIIVVSGVLIYLLLSYFNNFFDKTEKEFLLKVLPVKLWR
ncbi:MAG: oligosaccharide flippase family protein [Phycisphaerae bacterium]|nr:oligosaccharide flippase family protein [Phycisphaerae bacterium]